MFVLFDAVHGVNAGNVRALGRQKVVSISTLLCYYGLGLPLALIFGFELKMGLNGFWLGYLIAMGLLDLIVSYLVVSADWVATFGAPAGNEHKSSTVISETMLPGQFDN